jgi:hypothetical protein
MGEMGHGVCAAPQKGPDKMPEISRDIFFGNFAQKLLAAPLPKVTMVYDY